MHGQLQQLPRTMTNQPYSAKSFAHATAFLVIPLLLASCGGGSRNAGPALSSVNTGSSASYIAALGGGVVSRAEGVTLGKADRQRALEAEYRALEMSRSGQEVVWAGSGVKGSVVANAPYQVGSQNCRQYRHTVTTNGQEIVARGAACRNTDGTWTPLG